MSSTSKVDTTIEELLTMDTAYWELIDQTGQLSIFKRPRKADDGLYEYFARGILPDVRPEIVHDTLMDLDFRREWDGYKPENLRMLPLDGELPSSTFVEAALRRDQHEQRILWIMDYPWPMKPREYIVSRESHFKIKDREDLWVILQSIDGAYDVPPTAGTIRVEEYTQRMIIQPSPDTPFSSLIHYHYFEDPKSTTPPAVYSWAISQGIPAWIKRFTTACKNYAEGKYSTASSVPGAKELRIVLEESLAKGFILQ